MLASCSKPGKTIEREVPNDPLVNLNSDQMPTTSTEVKHEKRVQLNPAIPPFTINVTPQQDVSMEHCDAKSRTCTGTDYVVNQSTTTLPLTSSLSNDIALQEMIKLQAKQTELSAMIAEQQQRQSLPVQEPPIFNGNSFDYPAFIRAFEVIIESRVKENTERLYFLNKYTTGKANEIIKALVTSNSVNGYQEAKKQLSQRFGDPYLVSQAYKTKLKAWPSVREGDSKGLQELSDLCCGAKKL